MNPRSHKVEGGRLMVVPPFRPCFVCPDVKILISPPHYEIPTDVDESACCPGCSSCAKLGDLAACSTCPARTASKHGESSDMKPVRRIFEVPDLKYKDLSVMRRLGLSGGVRVMYSARI